MRLWALVLSLAFTLPARAQDATARAQLVTDVASAADTAGADSAHPLTTESDDLARGRSRDVPVSLVASRCYVAIARGAGIDNLDVAFVRGHTVLARDTDTGPSARASYCAPAAAEHVAVRVTAFRGQGAFALGVYEQAAGAEAATVDAGVTGTPLERLAALTFAQPGFAPIGASSRETLTEGQHVERELHFVPGRCYRVLVAADASISDVDLVLHAPDGGEVQRDGTSRPDASLGVLRPLCPATAGAYRLAITLARGAGTLAWQAIGSTAAGATAAAATEGPHFVIGGTGHDFLGTRIQARATQLVPGGNAASDVLRATLQTSQAFDGTVTVASTSCYFAVGAAAPSTRELSLVVHDALGNELGRSSEHDAFPSARFCPQVSGTARVEIRAVIGYGQAAAQLVAVPR